MLLQVLVEWVLIHISSLPHQADREGKEWILSSSSASGVTFLSLRWLKQDSPVCCASFHLRQMPELSQLWIQGPVVNLVFQSCSFKQSLNKAVVNQGLSVWLTVSVLYLKLLTQNKIFIICVIIWLFSVICFFMESGNYDI